MSREAAHLDGTDATSIGSSSHHCSTPLHTCFGHSIFTESGAQLTRSCWYALLSRKLSLHPSVDYIWPYENGMLWFGDDLEVLKCTCRSCRVRGAQKKIVSTSSHGGAPALLALERAECAERAERSARERSSHRCRALAPACPGAIKDLKRLLFTHEVTSRT